MKGPWRDIYLEFIRVKRGTIMSMRQCPKCSITVMSKKCAVRAQRSLRSLRRIKEGFTK